ncbi:beta strand repeat-containing protein [Methylobacterium radiodurans]|uniref:Calx-beta domain-containing protein n=1 Tax=Methylobacterium radiodurans TaxID=2202828 RepID=A0A2U8VYW9_9HYPH|nr:FG-GAP-like repeat-containing protein [Methylobacterium radiodurans]AWN38561.1 hypothetical protein DK427_24830 [Methylobacterium radiodurans]
MPATFGTATTTLVESEPWELSAADLNGDGKLDLVVPNTASNSLSVLIGNGDGSFRPAVNYPVSSSPISGALADVTGDGKIDIVVGINGAPSLLAGNGDGTFQAAAGIAGGNALQSYWLRAVDLNADGKLDLAYTNFGPNQLVVQYGNGDGTFGTGALYSVGNLPRAPAIGDFNHDGKLDIVTANSGATSVSVLLANADGTYQSQVPYPVGASPYSVATGDFNGDGNLDLVTAALNANSYSVLLGRGDGTFQPALTTAAQGNSNEITVADVDGDGKLDLIIANSSANQVGIAYGQGDGTFSAWQTLPTGGGPYTAIAVDLNGDGRLDLAVTNRVSGTVTTYMQSTPPTLSITGATVVEGNSGTADAAFVVTRSDTTGSPTATYTITNSTTDGADFGPGFQATGTVTFAAGATTATINVPIRGDTLYEASETFTVALSNPQGATISGTGQATGTITNDDAPPTVTLSGGTSIAEGNSGTTVVPITATLSAVSGLATTVTLAFGGTATQGTDYTVSSTTITIPAGSLSGSVNVNVLGDTAVEPNGTATVTIATATNATPAGAAQTVTIQNDDVSYAITASAAAVAEGSSGAGNAVTYTVTRTGDMTQAGVATVRLSGEATRGDDYSTTLPANGQINFVAGDASKTFTVTTVPDTTVEPNERVIATITGVSGQGGATIGTPASATTTITNDDQYGVSITATDASKLEGNTGTTPFTFTVSRTGGTADAITLAYAVTGSGASAADAADFGGTLPSGTVTIAAGQASTTLMINVTGDGLVEADDGFTVTLSNATANATIVQSTAIGTIRNDDQPPYTPPTAPTAVADTGSVTLGTALTKAAPGVLANDSGAGATLTVTAVNGQAANVGKALAGAYGNLTLNADGSYSYAPDFAKAVFTGSVVDHFTYTDTANGQTATTSLDIAVAPPSAATLALFGTVVTNPASQTGGIYGLYTALLNRVPDALGLEGFSAAIQAGSDLTTVASALLGSAERGGTVSDPTTYVQGLYANALHRTADAGGLNFFVNELNAGVSQATVAVQIATSSEAQSLNTPAFQRGVFVTDAIDAGVARLYYGLLNRSPDAGGLGSFEGLVKQAAASGAAAGAIQGLATVANVMLGSPEFAATHAGQTSAAYVDSLYVGALGRHADAAGASYFGAELAQGVSRATVALQIVESAEAQVHLVGVIEQGFQLTA